MLPIKRRGFLKRFLESKIWSVDYINKGRLINNLMPTRTIKAYKRGKVSVKSYKQKYKKHRGAEPKAKDKIPRSMRSQQRTSWLKDKEGEFTGRAGKDGETTSRTHETSGKDFTGIKMDKLGRIYGRYKSKEGRSRYSQEIKKAHPKK